MTAVADATQLIFLGGGTNGKGFLSKDKVSSVAPILSCISCNQRWGSLVVSEDSKVRGPKRKRHMVVHIHEDGAVWFSWNSASLFAG